MIKASDLVQLFERAYAERWGYIWDGRGQIWTQAMQDAATREMTVQYGSKWIGRRVADCSGLFVWAYAQHGERIFHGSNTIFNDYTGDTGALFGEVEIFPGTAVFQVKDGRRTHIGLYVGDGMVIEARGTRSGVIVSDLSEWDEWGQLAAVDYEGVEPDVVMIDTLKALRQGDSGLTVAWLQEQLWSAGYDVGDKGADGIFGKATRAAVEAFQRAHGLTVDGIAGKKTMEALRTLTGKPDQEQPEDNEPEMSLEEKVGILWDWMMAQRGENNGESP